MIMRDGLNIRCAEKLLQKEKYHNYHINLTKEFVKIDKFIQEEKIEVCLQTKDLNSNDLNNKEKKKKKMRMRKKTIKKIIKEVKSNLRRKKYL